MAEGLGAVRASRPRHLDAQKGGHAPTQLQRLAGCIDRGVAPVQAEHAVVREHLKASERVAATLEVAQGSADERPARFTRLQEELAGHDTPSYQHGAALLASFACAGR